MFRRNAYLDKLKGDLSELINNLHDLTDLQKHFLRLRWLDQVLWIEGRANSTKAWYLVLRLTTIVGGVLIPTLVKLSPSTEMVTLGVSLLVAISAAVEGFLRFGEQWRHYRLRVELLKNEGWQFLQLSGNYRGYPTHAKAYKFFAFRVEKLSHLEVEEYINEVVRDKKQEEAEDEREKDREKEEEAVQANEEVESED